MILLSGASTRLLGELLLHCYNVLYGSISSLNAKTMSVSFQLCLLSESKTHIGHEMNKFICGISSKFHKDDDFSFVN
jgi:hypothetical protein